MKFSSLALSILVIIILLLTNTLLVLFVFKYNPSFLIGNQKYQSEHQEIIKYIFSGNSQKLSKVLPHAEFTHIQDVRNVISKIPFTLFFILTLAGYLVKKYQNISLNEVLKYSLIIIFVLFLAGATVFMPLFIFFHQVIFPQGNWAFPPDSILIQLYPDQFWKITASLVAVLVVGELLIINYRKNKV